MTDPLDAFRRDMDLPEPEDARAPAPSHPHGWEPGVAWDGSGGAITTGPLDAQPADWSELLRQWDLDPERVEVIEPVEFRSWDAAIGNGEVRRMRYYRARLRTKRPGAIGIEELLPLVKTSRQTLAIKQRGKTDGPWSSFVVPLSDWQLGKRGTPGTVSRITTAIDETVRRMRRLQRQWAVNTVVLPCLGDLGESCQGHYCVSAETPILTRGLQWVPAGQLAPGEGLYAFDEHAPERQPGALKPGRKPRHYAPSVVTANHVSYRQAVRVLFTDGSHLDCTPDHPVVARRKTGADRRWNWVEAQRLTDDHELQRPLVPWRISPDYNSGWMGGILDGEGCLTTGKPPHNGPGCLQVSQLPGAVLDRAQALLARDGFRYGVQVHARSGVATLKVRGGYSEVLRALGIYRPVRLLQKLGYPEIRTDRLVGVVHVAPLGAIPIANMSTSSGTYISNGFLSHNTMQTFEVELDGREQARLGRRLLLYAIDAFRPHVERIVVPAVAGNHGEKRRDGKAYTTFGDNVDLEIPEGVAEACAMNPRAYGHVSFVIPHDKLTLTLDVAGTIVGLAHGHQARSGPSAQAKVANWWSGQAFGQRAVGDARILFTGHNHHLSVLEHGPRTHIQVPAMDSGSQWWDETRGLPARSGLLSVVVDATGWHELEVI